MGPYQSLKDDLFAVIDYPPAITKLIGAAEPWREFCRLPQKVKNQFGFPTHQEAADPGYQLRSRAAGREDKEYFHVYSNIRELARLDGLDELFEQHPALGHFFEYAVEVQRIAYDFALTIGRGVGREAPELTKLIEGGKTRSVLRCLHYTNDDQTDVIAAQHFDRTLYTLHLYESDSGLQFLDWDMRWKDAPIGEGKTVVFTGYRGEVLAKGELQKTWHRVVRKDGVRDRVSMVLFVWTDAVPDYDRTARSQDLKPSYVRI